MALAAINVENPVRSANTQARKQSKRNSNSIRRFFQNYKIPKIFNSKFPRFSIYGEYGMKMSPQ